MIKRTATITTTDATRHKINDRNRAKQVNKAYATAQITVIPTNAQYHGSSDSSEALREPTPEEIARTGRNDPCPCGSGKRLKDCHGKLA